jgi:uncharacterized protein (TIGR02302 family)
LGLTIKRGEGPEAKLDGLARRAAWVLLWERIWPPLAAVGVVIGAFLAASWFGLWFVTPEAARLVGLGLFALAIVAALAPLARLRWPSRADALARLDADARDAHRPASGYDDALANPSYDPTTQALWALHRDRLARRVERMSVEPPAPGMAARDPRALRFAVILIALAAGLAAGSERYARVAAAFVGREAAVAAAAPARVDAWIDPPAYTGRPPLLLKVVGQEKPENVVTPEDSVLVVRSAKGEVDTRVEGALQPAEAKPDNGVDEKRFVIHGDGKLALQRDGAALASFAITATPKGQPVIKLLDPPRANLTGSLTLHYAIADAYGVSSAEADFAPTGGGAPAPRHSLAEPPKLALMLPGAANGVGEGRTTSDLAEHPWAGANVTMTLRATDFAGQVGHGDPVLMRLPQRSFVKPLAKALVEQRRDLIIDPDRNRPRLAKVLDALLLSPESFDTPANIYLGLRQAKKMTAEASGDKDLLEVAALLWAIALQIEDGDASQAQRDLRAAEQKLRDALQRGASDEEIKALTKELRETAERFMQEMARQDKNNANPEDQPMDSKDLESMLDRMEDTARNGAKDDAQAMLDELQDMFENMKSAREGSPSPAQRQMRKQLGELGKLLRDQQNLRDDTFRQDQRERSGRPQDGQQPPNGKSLEQRQSELRDRLEEMKRQLKSLGMKSEKGFDDADGAMGEAQRDLKGEGEDKGEGQPKEGDSDAENLPGDGGPAEDGPGKGAAVGAQGRALKALRDGAQGLQQQMQGQGDGDGSGGYRAVGRNGQKPGRDPLGRGPNGARGASEGQLNEGPEGAQRARRVLQELRRRLGDPNRPADERDYLERLLGQE